MIIYDLQCQNGHTFEGWFEDARTFARQQEGGLVACPVCNTTSVVRIPSTFAIKGATAASQPRHPQAEAARMARALAEYVDRTFDNVGPDFATEALKIHYGVAKPRNIRGVSTAQEEKTLKQEGVEFFKFPLPDDTSNTPSEPDA